ncbi:MAG: HAD-IIIC family phosphatase [Sandaracinaceae bacterium]
MSLAQPVQAPAPRAPQPSGAERSLARARWQGPLYGSRLSRNALRELTPSWPTAPLRVRVHRNHAFEPVASTLGPFLALWGRAPLVRVGAYDDSLTFAVGGEADVELLWLDYARYRLPAAELAAWLGDRLAVLRGRTSAPILVVDPVGDDPGSKALRAALEAGLPPGVTLLPQSGIARSMGGRYLDARAAPLTGTTLSNQACLETARHLGLRWLPAAVAPRLKAVFIDLDHTLYAGVLGEDGVDGVLLTDAHRELQEELVRLRDEGVLLGVVSRNEAADAEALFAARADFPLRRHHLDAFQVSWEPKAAAVEVGARSLAIGTDAVLFVDDNPGEIAAVSATLPGVVTLHAADPAATLAGLRWTPRLRGYRRSREDRLRARDLAANAERAALRREVADPRAYLESLAVELTFARDGAADTERAAALLRKTNQLNASLARTGEATVATYAADPRRALVTAALRDRLSDSGVIAVMLLRLAGEELAVDELCISCRALGRGVEGAILLEALRRVAPDLGGTRLRVRFREGPRNEPARRFVEQEVGPLRPAPDGTHVAEAELIDLLSRERLPVRVTWRTP